MDEYDTLPLCLECIEKQTYPQIKIVVCVNQPESLRENEEKKYICENNTKSLNFLKKYKTLPHTVIDKSSEGKGWQGKKHGVGWARKVVMDHISSVADSKDIIISMDADTLFNPNFCETIVESFQKYNNATALALPYYHNLTGDVMIDRVLLRYEIYMRYYAINLWRIKNPYCFTAIGSSMAIPVSAYHAVKGIAPKLSGEDFYFMQKLRKYGSIIVWNEERTYPATRYSDRVFFGTGPALIKGVQHDWDSYPMYSYHIFNEVKETFDLFGELYTKDVDTPMTDFLEQTFLAKNLWQPLRKNFITKEKFVKACTEKVDGLRILQYLKSKQCVSDNDAVFLTEYMNMFHQRELIENSINVSTLHFDKSSISELNNVRDLLFSIENSYRKKYGIIDWW